MGKNKNVEYTIYIFMYFLTIVTFNGTFKTTKVI